MTVSTKGAGTLYPSGVPYISHIFQWVLVPHFWVVFCGSLLVVLFFSSAIFLNSYKYQEIAHIYLQNNLFGVVDIAFTSNEYYYRFNHCRIKSLTRGLVFPRSIYRTVYMHTGVNVDASQQWKKILPTAMLFYCCNFIWGLRNNNHSPWLLQFVTVNIPLCYNFIP